MASVWIGIRTVEKAKEEENMPRYQMIKITSNELRRLRKTGSIVMNLSAPKDTPLPSEVTLSSPRKIHLKALLVPQKRLNTNTMKVLFKLR